MKLGLKKLVKIHNSLSVNIVYISTFQTLSKFWRVSFFTPLGARIGMSFEMERTLTCIELFKPSI